MRSHTLPTHTPSAKPESNRGFSLVELSIVLVIIGLLVGSILTGRELIHASELRAVSSQYSQMWVAVNAFKDKYMGLPGDITNATKIWGSEAAPCATTPSSGKLTCDGDGDGLINRYNTGGTSQEDFRFWQQLANAGFISGQYTGVLVTATGGQLRLLRRIRLQARLTAPSGVLAILARPMVLIQASLLVIMAMFFTLVLIMDTTTVQGAEI
jgi:prepilin-type N-terminal cleavage/methylation domain-containing protein